MNQLRQLACIAGLLSFVPFAWGQTKTVPVLPTGSSALDALVLPHAGKIESYSSYDRKGGNDDFWPVAPGQTVTLVDRKGAGEIKRLWLTIAPWNNVYLQRQGIIRCYWAGETSPSVEVPVADFFGMGFGQWHQYISQPLSMTSGGDNCYWPMPFHKSARITFENRSNVRVDALYFNVAVSTAPPPPNALYFHAQFRQTISKRGAPISILEATGRGQYVGTLLSMQPLRGKTELFLEGDEQVFVDGETTPSIQGTGTEDYFDSGWYFNTGVYSAPYHGVTMIRDGSGRVNAYRWHIEDPIPFQKSLRFQIGHGPQNDTPNVYYSSVAYWYQTHPHAAFPPLPTNLLPPVALGEPRIEGIIEGESLRQSARADAGNVLTQDMNFEGTWSGNEQLWWRDDKVGNTLHLMLDAPKAGTYELVGYFTQAKDYGTFTLSVNGQQIGQSFNGYNPEVKASGAVSFGTITLQQGKNTLDLRITGKDERSEDYMVGIDGFKLIPK